jgi:hypothetical protein
VLVRLCSGVHVSFDVRGEGFAHYCSRVLINRWIDVEGCLMMAIPSEKDKGKAFSLFWAIVSRTSPACLDQNFSTDTPPTSTCPSSTRVRSWAP